MKDGIYSLPFYEKNPVAFQKYSYAAHLFIFQQRFHIATLMATFFLDTLINPN